MNPLRTRLLVASALYSLAACGGGGSASTAPEGGTFPLTGETFQDAMRIHWSDFSPAGEYDLFVLAGDEADLDALLVHPDTLQYHGVHPGVVATQLLPGQMHSIAVSSIDASGTRITSRVLRLAPDAMASALPPLDRAGAEWVTGGVQVDVAADALWRDTQLAVLPQAFPVALPGVQVSEPIEIVCNHPDAWNAPMRVRIRYHVPEGMDESRLIAWQYDESTSNVQPVAVLDQDRFLDTVDLELRQQGPVAVTAYDDLGIPSSMTLQPLTLEELAWNGGEVAELAWRGGTSLSTSALSLWRQLSPYFHYGYGTLTPGQRAEMGLRVALALEDWLDGLDHDAWFGGELELRRKALQQALVRSNRAQIALLHGVRGYRAVVVCGYDAEGFEFVDPLQPSEFQHLPWHAGGFDGFEGYDQITWVGLPTLVRGVDLNTLLDGMIVLYPGAAGEILLQQPLPLELRPAGPFPVSGSIAGPGNASLYLFDNTAPAPLRVDGHPIETFSVTSEGARGHNRVMLVSCLQPEPRSNWLWNASFTQVEYFGIEVPDAATVPLAGMVYLAPRMEHIGSQAVGGAPNYVGPDETPMHPVVLSGGFWMGATEVTQAEFETVMGYNPSSTVGSTLPVDNVSWDQARAFCAVLTLQERGAGHIAAGYEYRLPTEAEWEVACRGGFHGYFAFGNELACDQARFAFNNGTLLGCGAGGLAPVASYPANAFGLFDMHGNVEEWCLDSKTSYSSQPTSDPLVTGQPGDLRIVRGGKASSSSAQCRSAVRPALAPDTIAPEVGFRYVLAPVIGF